MKELINKNTLTTLEILEQINMFRKEEGKKELRHDTLMSIVKEEFEEEISLQKILESNYINSRNKTYKMFVLTLSEAKQILVRESKFVRKKIINYINELENKIKENIKIDSYMISDPIERAKAWIKEEEERKELALKNKNLTTEIIHKEDVIVGLVKDITLAEKRQRITQIIRFNSIEYKNRYSLLYSEFEKNITLIYLED